MISSGSAIQTKGFASVLLCSSMKRWMASTEFADGAEHAVLEPPARQLGEEPLYGVEPRARGRGEVERPARMRLEPCPDRLVLVGGVVVEDGMDRPAGGDRTVDAVEKAHEFLVPVAGAVLRDHRPFEYVEGGEQRRRAVPLVVVGHGGAAPLLQRQSGLCAVQRLDLRLLVDRQHRRVRRRLDVEADDVTHLVDEGRIGRQLEPPPAVRRQAVCLPDRTHRRGGHTRGLRHRPQRPVRRFPGRGGAEGEILSYPPIQDRICR